MSYIVDACMVSRLRACYNLSGTCPVIAVLEINLPDWRFEVERKRPVSCYTQRADTGEWVRREVNLPMMLGVNRVAWQPLMAWPDGWPFGDSPTRPPIGRHDNV